MYFLCVCLCVCVCARVRACLLATFSRIEIYVIFLGKLSFDKVTFVLFLSVFFS
jgi:hypothetical protein